MARVFISHSSRDAGPAARIKAWLQDQRFDTPFLDFDKHAGIPPGSNWEKTLYREIERSEAIIIVQTPNWLDSKWCFAEYTQARALGKPIFPVIETPPGDTSIAPDIQSLNLSKDRDGGLEQLARELTRIALDAQGGFSWDTVRPPYPGLLAFQEEDAAIYFGRDDDIRRLIERLNARRAQGGTKLIALLGASGSGKSSLLRAGVIPRIKRDPRNWIALPPMRPQAHPIDELARTVAIALDKGAEWRVWRDRLREGDVTDVLGDLANDLRVRFGANEAQILISIDQAEELFGTSVAVEADRFFAILNVAMSEPLPYLGLLTQRSDYLERLQSTATLTVGFEQFSLGPLPVSRYAQIIEGPARVAGIGIEDGLVQQASRDAETEDALPLLAFALRELYDRNARHDTLTLTEYHRLGDPTEGLTPLENAVRKAADTVLDEARPTGDQLMALRDAFVPAMVQVNDKGEFARRPARWDALPATAHPILERLAKARLLILRQDGDARMVEVAHEALLRKWPRLRGWLEDAREFLTGRQQLERDLTDWERAPAADKSGALLSGLKLNRARGWLAERAHQLSVKERAFVLASIDQADAEAREKEERQRREIRRNRRITLGASLVGVIMAGLAVFSSVQWRNAKLNLEVAQANQLAAAAQVDQNHLLFFPRRSLLLATESLKRFASVEADQTVRKALAITPRPRTSVRLDGPIESIAFSGDGHVFAVRGEGYGRVRVGEVATGKTMAEIPVGESTQSIALNPDGSRIAILYSGSIPTIVVWDTRAIKEVLSVPRQAGVSHAAFSRNGTHLYLTDERGKPINSVSVDESDPRYLTAEAIIPVRATAEDAYFSPDGQYVAEVGRTGQISVVEGKSGRVISQIETYLGSRPITFTRDGSHFFMTEYSGPHDQAIHRAWRVSKEDAETEASVVEVARLISVSGEPRFYHFTATSDGRRLLALERAEGGAQLKAWDIVGGEVPFSGGEGSSGGSERARPGKNSEQEFKQLEDRVVRQWPRGVARPPRLSVSSDGSRQIVRFAVSDDGRHVATIDFDSFQIIHIWDLALGREVARIRDAPDPLEALYFTDKYLVAEGSAAEKTTKQYWLWRHRDMTEEACRRLTRNFSRDEWFQYLGNEPYRLTCPNLPVPSRVEEENSQAELSPRLDGVRWAEVSSVFRSFLRTIADTVARRG